MCSMEGVSPLQRNSSPEQLVLDALAPPCWWAEDAADSAAKGDRVMGGALVGKEAFTFSDPRTLQMANAGLLLFPLSSHSCLKPSVVGVLTAFR